MHLQNKSKTRDVFVKGPRIRHLASDSHHTRGFESRFGYDGADGPLAWHELSPDNALCATVKNQSPINMEPGKEVTVDGSSLAFQLYSYPHGVELENIGDTVQANVNGSVMLNDWVYNLVQFHFHTPSEHHLLGEHYPAEVGRPLQSQRSVSTRAISFDQPSQPCRSPVSSFSVGRVSIQRLLDDTALQRECGRRCRRSPSLLPPSRVPGPERYHQVQLALYRSTGAA